MDWLQTHRDEATFGAIAIAVIVFVALLNRRKASNPTSVAAAASDMSSTNPPQTVYLPTSETYVTEASTETNSNNTAAPGAPVSVGSPITTVGPTTGASTTTTTNTVNNPPPVVSSPVTASTGSTTTKVWDTPLAARNGIGDNTIKAYFQQFALPPWIGFWFVADHRRLPNSIDELQTWLNNNGLRNPQTQTFTPLVSSASIPPSVATLFAQVYPAANEGGAIPVHTTHVVRPGETLGDMGNRYGVAWQKIYAANKAAIDAGSHAQGHPIPGGPWNNIVMGQPLKIPVA